MNEKEIMFGFILAFIFGFGFGFYVCLDDQGEKIEIKQCLNENPQICRDITIYYTKYKQHGEIPFNANVKEMLNNESGRKD